MDFLELAKGRYSVRKFDPRPVEEEKLQKILEAGRVAPTAKNMQPQRIYVLESPEAISAIREITTMAFDAPMVLVLCGNPGAGWVNPFNNRNSTEMDCSIVLTHMMLEAADLGLGTTWVGWFDTAAVKQRFDIPAEEEVYALLPLGYPAENCRPARIHEVRKDLSETVVRK